MEQTELLQSISHTLSVSHTESALALLTPVVPSSHFSLEVKVLICQHFRLVHISRFGGSLDLSDI